MSWYDEYEPQEPSEVDSIVQDALDKLEEYIIDHSKLNINQIIQSAQNWEKRYHDCKAENRKFFSMITERDDKIKELERELDRKRTQLGILPFEPGEDVYYLYQDYRDTQKFTCPRCDGKGKITLIHDGIEYSCTCPQCHDSNYRGDTIRESSYHPWKIACSKVESITQVVTFDKDTKESKIEVICCVDGTGTVPITYVRKRLDGGLHANESIIKELQNIADELNECLKNGCLMKVGREAPNDSNS